MTLVLIFVGGGVGSVCRYLLAGFVQTRAHVDSGAVNESENPPPGATLTSVARKNLSSRVTGCVCAYRTTFNPLRMPIPAPSITSLAQCLSVYMRARPTAVAAPYSTGATNAVCPGHARASSLVTAEAAAKPMAVCAEGKLE